MLIQYIYTKYSREEYQFHLYTGTDTFIDILEGKWLNVFFVPIEREIEQGTLE